MAHGHSRRGADRPSSWLCRAVPVLCDHTQHNNNDHGVALSSRRIPSEVGYHSSKPFLIVTAATPKKTHQVAVKYVSAFGLILFIVQCNTPTAPRQPPNSFPLHYASGARTYSSYSRARVTPICRWSITLAPSAPGLVCL